MTISTNDVRWASVTETDPVTGRQNIEDVPNAVKDVGLKRNQPFARQWLNSHLRKIGEALVDAQTQINNVSGDTGTDDNLNALAARVATAEGNIASNTGRLNSVDQLTPQITTNKNNLATLQAQVDALVLIGDGGSAAAIADNAARITSLEGRVTVNENNIQSVEDDVLLLQGQIGLAGILEASWPVGSIYQTTSATVLSTPLSIGTWKRLDGVFLAAQHENPSNAGTWTGVAGTRGGQISHSHGVDIEVGGYAYLPEHTRNDQFANRTNSGTQWPMIQHTNHAGDDDEDLVQGKKHYHDVTGNTKNTTTLPPFLTVHMWERTS